VTKHRKAISRLSVLSSPSWPPFSRQAIPILAIIPAQIPGLRPTSLWPTTINKTLSKQRTKVEPEMQLASLGLSFIALFLCDERASIRKLKMYFAFRSPLLLLLPSGEKGMKCNKNETEMRTPHGASGTGEKLQEKRAKYGNGAELRSKWQSHLAHCTLPGNSNTGSSGNYQQFTTILAPPLG